MNAAIDAWEQTWRQADEADNETGKANADAQRAELAKERDKLLSDEATRSLFLDVVYEMLKRQDASGMFGASAS